MKKPDMSRPNAGRLRWGSQSSGVERPSLWSRARAAVGVLAALVLTVTGVGLTAGPAQAATTGAGWFSQSVGHLGNYVTEGGLRVYCAEADHFPGPTVGHTDDGTLVGAGWAKYRGGGVVSELEAVQMNHILTHYGQTDNAEQAAAVSMFLWSVVSPATYNSHAYPGDQWYITRAPAGSRPQIKALLDQFRAEAANVSLPAPSVSGSASLNIHMTDAYNGTVTVSTTPADAWGMLYLEGATVAGTGATQVPVVNGSVATIVGKPVDDQGKYAVRARADFTANVGGGLAANFRIHNTGDGSAQKTMSHGTPATSQISFSANEAVTDPLNLQFAPVLSSTVGSKYVAAGEKFVDTVIFRTPPGSPKWRERSDGSYYEVMAKGTLYGPFDSPLVESADVPAGAPVAGTAEIRTSRAGGPNEHYRAEVESNGVGGHYTWVWRIKAAEQTPATRLMMVDGYDYADRFGQTVETSIRPFKVQGTSQLSHTTVPLSSKLTDTFVPVAPDSNWLHTDPAGMSPVELSWRVTSYFVPGDPEVALPVSKTVPDEAEEIAHELVTTTGDPMTTAKPIVADSHRAGHVTVQWCLNTADQQPDVAPLVVPWCDDFGLPSETASVTLPAITTEAQPTVTLYAGGTQTLADTAIVDGPLPAAPMAVRFKAYVEAYGEDGQTPVCGSDNLVWESTKDITVTEAGRYRSQSWDPLEVLDPELLPKLGTDTPVKIWFVESAHDARGRLIVSGECGLENETARLYNPEISSVATGFGKIGDKSHDQVFVAGAVPDGASAVWDVYSHAVDAAEPVCDASTLVWSSTAAVPVVAGQEALVSEDVALPVGVNLWVATILDSNGDVIRRGECGEQGEVTIIDPQDCLPRTGFDGDSLRWPLLAGGVFLMLGGALLMVRLRKRGRGAVIATALLMVTGVAGVSMVMPQSAFAAEECGPSGRTFTAVAPVDPSMKPRIMPELDDGDTDEVVAPTPPPPAPAY